MKKGLEYLLAVSSLFFSGCSFSLKSEMYSSNNDVQYQKIDSQGTPTTVYPLLILEFDKEKDKKNYSP